MLWSRKSSPTQPNSLLFKVDSDEAKSALTVRISPGNCGRSFEVIRRQVEESSTVFWSSTTMFTLLIRPSPKCSSANWQISPMLDPRKGDRKAGTGGDVAFVMFATSRDVTRTPTGLSTSSRYSLPLARSKKSLRIFQVQSLEDYLQGNQVVEV